MSEEVDVVVESTRFEPKVVKVRKGETVESVIKALGLNPVEYVAVLNGQIVPEDEPIPAPTKLKLIPVVSGG
ncbi:MAG: MoaD/ThiS family protein [Thermofilaceae archaeon]